MVNIYVLNKDGTPLMPSHSYGRVKRMIANGKARIAVRKPFTIRLTYQIEEPKVDECILGIDPGRTNIGACVIDSDENVLFSSNCETRNKDIHDLMLARKNHRNASRRGEREVRKRRAIASDKTGMARAVEFWRSLPGTKKPVRCKVIRNQPSRFQHRKRKKGWLTPTANHLLQTHINLVKKIMKFLPVSCIGIEINKFDFARMENPGIRNWEYQKGRLFGFVDVNEAVDHMQNGKCLLCGKKIKYHHHIKPISQGGSNTIDNIVGLCEECHYGDHGVHKDPITKAKLAKKKAGLEKKYHALSVLNQIMSRLLNQLSEIKPTYVTTGWETHQLRVKAGLPKKTVDDGTHYMDAWCIAASLLNEAISPPDFKDCFYNIKQFRRHDRKRVKAQKERTYYLDGKAVAKNRHMRTGQADAKTPMISLAEFRAMYPKEVSKLTVKKSTRSYNDMDRMLPGAEVLYEKKRYIVSGKHNERYILIGLSNNGVPTSQLTVLRLNAGLVFM